MIVEDTLEARLVDASSLVLPLGGCQVNLFVDLFRDVRCAPTHLGYFHRRHQSRSRQEVVEGMARRRGSTLDLRVDVLCFQGH
jgi:hypothetical protein